MENALHELIETLRIRPSGALISAMLDEAGRAVDASEALDWLSGFDGVAQQSESVRLASARFLLEHERADAALAWADLDTATGWMLQARAHHALGDNPTALGLYEQALAADSELEDPDFRRRIAPTVQAQGQERGVVLSLQGERIDQTQALPDIPVQPRDQVTFADVGGLDDVKRQIHRRIIAPMQKPSLFQRFKRKAGGGVLLYGPPGCGKTLMARATAGEAGAKFFQIEIAEILDMYIGESEKRLAAAFETARAQSPSVIFIDEIEALAAKRRYGENDNRASVVSTFLTEMDGFSSNNQGVLILAASNVPWSIDSAFLRPGRFDRSIFVPPPDREARKVILDLLLADRPVASNINLDPLVEATSGFSGADLSGIVEEACDIAIEDSLESNAVEDISARHLKEALGEIKPSTLDWLTQARNYVKFSNQSGFYDDVAAFLNKHTTSR